MDGIPEDDLQSHLDMIQPQLAWAKISIDNLSQLEKIFETLKKMVSTSPSNARVTMVDHWLVKVGAAVVAAEEFLTHIMTGIERLRNILNRPVFSDHPGIQRLQVLDRLRADTDKLWVEFRKATNALANKVTDICLDFELLVLNLELMDRLASEEAITPGTVLRLIGLPPHQKKEFFLEVVKLWDLVQNLDGLFAFPERKKALDRLQFVTAQFNAKGFYETEEQAAANSAGADPQTHLPATKSGSMLEDQANDAATGAETEVEPQSPSTLIGDQDDHFIQLESLNTAMGDGDGNGYAHFEDPLE